MQIIVLMEFVLWSLRRFFPWLSAPSACTYRIKRTLIYSLQSLHIVKHIYEPIVPASSVCASEKAQKV